MSSASFAVPYIRGTGYSDLDWIVDGIRKQLASIKARTRNRRRKSRLQFLDELRRHFLILHLDKDLRVIQLLQLRRGRKPETRTAATHKRSHIAQDVTLLASLPPCSLRIALLPLEQSLHLQRSLIGRIEVRIVRNQTSMYDQYWTSSGKKDVLTV